VIDAKAVVKLLTVSLYNFGVTVSSVVAVGLVFIIVVSER
jgi:hypothetical protein